MDDKVFISRLGRIIGMFMLVFMWSGLSAQSVAGNGNLMTVKGVVVDAHTNEPISAVQISDLDKKFSAVTDQKGNFTIRLSSLNSILRVVAYDYNPVELSLRGRDSLVVKLYSDKFSNYFKNINISFLQYVFFQGLISKYKYKAIKMEKIFSKFLNIINK